MRRNTSWLVAVCLFFLLTGQACIRINSSSRPAGPTLLRSDDRGETWISKDLIGQLRKGKKVQTISITPYSANKLAFSKANAQLLVLSTENNGLYLSQNRGDQWAQTGYTGIVRDFALDPLNAAVVYIAADRTIQKTEDGGRIWKPAFTVTRAGENLTTVGVDMYNPQRVLAATNTGIIYLSQDAGLTWKVFSTINDSLFGLTFSPTDSRIVFILGAHDGIWKSTDGGQTFASLAPSLKDYPGATANIRLHFSDSRGTTIYQTSKYGLLRSRDFGQTWQSITTLVLPPSPIDAVVVDPANEATIALVIGNKLHRTTNGGENWIPSTLPNVRPLGFLEINPSDPSVLYIGSRIPPKKK